MSVLTYKGGDFYLDGEKYTIISGAMHYFRIPREYWFDRLLKLKECGFNTVETYTCWNLHEPTEGAFDFSGMLDLEAYIDIAAELGLNVILRPGPYICAEWEFGGLPAWLLNYKDMNIRCLDRTFISKVERYYRELLRRVVPRLGTNGGNIIMMQIENEYGSYGNDHEYMEEIARIYKDNGVDCLLYTSDGASYYMLSGGTLPEYPCVANFGSKPEENFKVLDDFRPNQPRMCGEYWCGWFDHWYEEHHVRDAKELSSLFKDMLDSGASLNFYMFHGGTNFGFMNGANYYEKYEPTVTSYDYNALLSEAGDLTPAYFEVRKMIERWQGKKLPELTVKNSEKAAYGRLELNERCDIFTALPLLSEPVHTTAPKFAEDIGQYYGFTMYSTVIEGPREDWELKFDAVHDRAVVFVDHKYRGYFERTRHEESIAVPLKKGEKARLDILCENMGRVNYGSKIMDRKGLKGIRFGLQYHFGWDMYPLPMTDLSTLKFERFGGKTEIASFLRGNLKIDGEPCDTFIRLDGFHKGVVFANGFNLGRYYNDAGPQKTLYVPAPVLKKGDNEIIVFETDGADDNFVTFTDTPDLG
ncbi:MAG: beta-galactosidase [Clostridiales bacterium]|nr:beta-galactosidase [Clostridiales bacterium]